MWQDYFICWKCMKEFKTQEPDQKLCSNCQADKILEAYYERREPTQEVPKTIHKGHKGTKGRVKTKKNKNKQGVQRGSAKGGKK